jgi:WhiB family redox-sensing transcriptional regulator
MKWMRGASCLEMDGDLWFPEVGNWAHGRQAIAICQECPVREQCLEMALRERIKFGIWGGLLPSQREVLLRNARKALADSPSPDSVTTEA